MDLRVRCVRSRNGIELPKYQTRGSSGFDLAAVEDVTIAPGETVVIPTGIQVELPQPLKLLDDMTILYELQVRPRGGTSLKTPLRIANSPGTVDNDYRGEVGIVATNISLDIPLYIEAGTRIAQGVVCPVVKCEIVEVTELTETERGSGAYGHTGDK